MKKVILIASLITSFAGLSAFGQGYFDFVTGKSQVYDCFSTGTPHTATTVDVAFSWASAGCVPTVDSIMVSTPPSAVFSPAAAWSAILTDPNFTLAVNSTISAQAIVGSFANGAISYNGGNAFPVLGTTPGTTYNLFIIGWEGIFATPQLAAAASASVGWSSVFSYTPSTITGIPSSFAGLTPAFGVMGMPEPSAMALAGLGGLTLLLFRRRRIRKQWLPDCDSARRTQPSIRLRSITDRSNP